MSIHLFIAMGYQILNAIYLFTKIGIMYCRERRVIPLQYTYTIWHVQYTKMWIITILQREREAILYTMQSIMHICDSFLLHVPARGWGMITFSWECLGLLRGCVCGFTWCLIVPYYGLGFHKTPSHFLHVACRGMAMQLQLGRRGSSAVVERTSYWCQL